MKTRKIVGVLIIIFFSFSNSLAQSSNYSLGQQFNILIAMNGLDSQVIKTVEDKGVKFVRLFSGGMLDINDDLIIEPETIKKNLDRFFPNKKAHGILVIDWEEQLMEDLKSKPLGSHDFINAFNQYLDAINIIKKLRPNLLVGIYGLPFRKFWNRDSKWEKNCEKLSSLLSYCDFIAPSLYLLYTNKQVGEKRNIAYLEDNLKMALQLGSQLDKPVLPFVWHRWHPSNKTDALKFLSDEEFTDYINIIKNYEFNGNHVAGIIWWDNPKLILKSKNKSRILSGYHSYSDYKKYEDKVLVKYLNDILSQ